MISHKGQSDSRINSSRRGYGAAWRVLRANWLKRNPCCCYCGAVGTDVDHIVPRRCGGTDDADNLQTLCHSCHSRKTVTHDGGTGRGRQISGNPTLKTAAQRRANFCEIGKNEGLGKGDGRWSDDADKGDGRWVGREVPSVVADRYLQVGAVGGKVDSGGRANHRVVAEAARDLDGRDGSAAWEGLVG